MSVHCHIIGRQSNSKCKVVGDKCQVQAPSVENKSMGKSVVGWINCKLSIVDMLSCGCGF